MKFEFWENEAIACFTLTPETAEETAELLRVVSNAKAVKPNIFFNFSGTEPYMEIDIEKVKPSAQKNSLHK